MPAEGRENPLLKKGNSDAFFREKYLTKNTRHSNRCPLAEKVLSLLPGMDLKCLKISLFSALFPWSYLLTYDIMGPV